MAIATSTRRRFRTWVLAAAAIIAGIALVVVMNRESPSAESSLPEWPAGVEEPAEYAFGDEVASRDQRAWGPVFDQMEDDDLRVVHLTVDASVDPGRIVGDLDREMVDERGWAGLTDQTTDPGTWTHGYQSPDGDDVLILVGLTPRDGDDLVPLTALTTLADR